MIGRKARVIWCLFSARMPKNGVVGEVNEPKRMYTRDVLEFPQITFENLKSYKKPSGHVFIIKGGDFLRIRKFYPLPKNLLGGWGGELLKVLTKTLIESYHIFKVLLEE